MALIHWVLEVGALHSSLIRPFAIDAIRKSYTIFPIFPRRFHWNWARYLSGST